MKKIIILLTLTMIAGFSFGQYIVTKVNGKVLNLSTNEYLKTGSKLAETDKVRWSSPHDMIRAIAAAKGIFILSPSKDAQSGESKLVDVVKFTLKIKSREFNLSGRGENDEVIPWVFSTESIINNKNLIAAANKYLFDTSQYKLSGGNSFFLQINHKNDAPVIKKLDAIYDTLFLYAESFFIGVPVDSSESKYTIGFYDRDQNVSRQLVKLYPYFDTANEMENLIKIIIDSDGHGDMDQVKVRCYQEVYETMGKPSYIVFNQQFDKLYNTLRKKSD